MSTTPVDNGEAHGVAAPADGYCGPTKMATHQHNVTTDTPRDNLQAPQPTAPPTQEPGELSNQHTGGATSRLMETPAGADHSATRATTTPVVKTESPDNDTAAVAPLVAATAAPAVTAPDGGASQQHYSVEQVVAARLSIKQRLQVFYINKKNTDIRQPLAPAEADTSRRTKRGSRAGEHIRNNVPPIFSAAPKSNATGAIGSDSWFVQTTKSNSTGSAGRRAVAPKAAPRRR